MHKIHVYLCLYCIFSGVFQYGLTYTSVTSIPRNSTRRRQVKRTYIKAISHGIRSAEIFVLISYGHVLWSVIRLFFFYHFFYFYFHCAVRKRVSRHGTNGKHFGTWCDDINNHKMNDSCQAPEKNFEKEFFLPVWFQAPKDSLLT